MAIPIKINCDCGQHYAFDVEPIGGRMPSAVACPGCGIDGTMAANHAITQAVAALPQPVAVVVEQPRLRMATAPSAPVSLRTPAPASPSVGETEAGPAEQSIDFTKAVNEAKAKVFWGDTKQQAIIPLIGAGMDYKEASRIIDGMMKDRAATIRVNGIWKIIAGCGLIAVPIIALLIFLAIHFIPIKIFAMTVMVGLYGVYMVIKGTFMMIAPKAEAGDVASH